MYAEDGTESVVGVGVYLYRLLRGVAFICVLLYVMCCILKLLMFYLLYMPYTIIYELCVEYSTVVMFLSVIAVSLCFVIGCCEHDKNSGDINRYLIFLSIAHEI